MLFSTRYSLVCAFFSSLLISMFLVSISLANFIPEPQRILEEASKEMIQLFIEKSDDIRQEPEIAHHLIREYIISKINFKLMSRWVLGSNWKKASPDQRQKFLTVFKQLIIKFYSKTLIEYLVKNNLAADIIIFKTFHGKINSKYVTIRSSINPSGGAEPVNVNYDMYHNKAGLWQIYDITIEGISLVTSYRSSFKKIVKEQGMDSLISQLQDKTSQIDKPTVASNKA